MKKSYDIGRLQEFGAGEVLAIAGNTLKTISGVCSQAVNVIVEPKGSGKRLFNVLPAGRFTFDVRHDTDLALWFEPSLKGSDVDIALVMPAKIVPRVGDPESTFTSVDHRPAINPELQAVMGELRLMQGEMRRLQASARAPARPAPATAPAPAVEAGERVDQVEEEPDA